MIGAVPEFDTRQDAETYAEDLAMKGYERSFGYDVRVEAGCDECGHPVYRVRMTRVSDDAK